jgi:hypothetical protein
MTLYFTFLSLCLIGADEDGKVYFRAPDDGSGEVAAELFLPLEDWKAMGEPTEVTLKVQPGYHEEEFNAYIMGDEE